MPQELFTLATLGTLAGATGATVIVGNTIQSVANYGAKWLSLVIAELIIVAVAFFAGATDVSAYFVALLNGCLVYASAIGLNTMTSPAQPLGSPSPRSANQVGLPPQDISGSRGRGFWNRWW
ncbi:hypothetical protein NKH92_23385 [Mesorhizobium sp. M0871]|uniref:hypothetical protein n=1 Tax=unclassified Mesorhizobium TaxID=325217 RepID=UPI0003D06A55|nr:MULTISPECIES: hypothetical protein [unclassified Mesorhizobium]ESZ02618.1 hypothetical protein X736_29195 [Mesorhizobium sp. L2C089B000]ESZ51037.1 hypothetical protein X731_03605 [Mesorhizobium sp. L2C054A000]WJI50533.1 hypothetical protein NLY44_29200 [Mesorhizobium sp. C089B]